MNVLEQMAQMANKGDLAEPIRAVEYVDNIEILTENYTITGPEKGKDGLTPPVVDGATIREEMAKAYRPKGNYDEVGTDENSPYLNKNDNLDSSEEINIFNVNNEIPKKEDNTIKENNINIFETDIDLQ